MPRTYELLQNLGSASDFEIISPTEAQAVSQERLTWFRKGNNDINIQLQRDIDMLSQAIVCYGSSSSDQIKAHTLLRIILLLYFGALSYRNKRDNRFHSWSELNNYCQFDCFPIAAVLLHGSRVLIEFPTDINEMLFDWLIPNKSDCWRYAATHGIAVNSEEEPIDSNVVKRLKEVKVNIVNATVAGVLTAATVGEREHYGIDIALGGVGKKNFFSGNTISTNGQHGHLYIHHSAIRDSASQGLLLSIEQSGPGAADQYGGAHDPLASAKEYSVSGGDFFCKPPNSSLFTEYVGLRELPIANYYDSFYNAISNDDFCTLKDAFEKSHVLLTLLPQEEQLNFIKALVSSSGNSNRHKFQQLFNSYFQKIPQITQQQESFLTKETVLQEEVNSLRQQLVSAELSIHKIQQVIQQQEAFSEKETVLQEEVSALKEQLSEANQKLSIQQGQIEAIIITQKLVYLESLQQVADYFMKAVTQKMGYGSKGSKKEINFIKLRAKLSSSEKLDEQALQQLLKNFIGLALRNRHCRRSGFTHSGRACLDLLNEPSNAALRKLLFPEHHDQIQLKYDDLLRLVDNNAESNKDALCSARYQQAMYTAFEKNSSNGSLDDSVLKSFVYSGSVKN